MLCLVYVLVEACVFLGREPRVRARRPAWTASQRRTASRGQHEAQGGAAKQGLSAKAKKSVQQLWLSSGKLDFRCPPPQACPPACSRRASRASRRPRRRPCSASRQRPCATPTRRPASGRRRGGSNAPMIGRVAQWRRGRIKWFEGSGPEVKDGGGGRGERQWVCIVRPLSVRESV